MPTELKLLIQRRGVTLGRLTKIRNFFKEASDLNKFQIQARLGILSEIWTNFNDAQGEIEDQDPTDEQLNKRDDFEFNFVEVKSELETLLAGHTEGSGGNNDNNKQSIKLPQINIPPSNGQIEEWMAFCDTFKSLIHENKTISAIEKFHYLKSSLGGEAKNVISSIEISAENYQSAFKLLKDRFDSKNIIIQKHITELFNLPPVSREDSILMRNLLDTFNKHFRALETLQQPVQHWDIFLI
jgi:hypothetical protein